MSVRVRVRLGVWVCVCVSVCLCVCVCLCVYNSEAQGLCMHERSRGGSEHFWIALPNKDRPDFL